LVNAKRRSLKSKTKSPVYSGLKVKIMSDKEFQGQIIQVNAGTKLPETVEKEKFPKFPFWGRLKISKNRTTLVIDEAPAKNNKTKQIEAGFVHREATSIYKKDREEINPNPDKSKTEPMYLKSPRKIIQKLVKPHEKDLDMPEHLKTRYEKNNNKDKTEK